MTFGAWLRAQLDRREWTSAEFSRQVGASTGRVSEWLNGKRMPNPASCDRIADVLGVDVDLVLTLAGHRPEVEPIPQDDPRARIISMVKRIDFTVDDRQGFLEDMLARWLRQDREKSARDRS